MILPNYTDIDRAASVVAEITQETACWHASKLSEQYGSNVWLKREDRQKVRSYKIRGAYCKIRSLSAEQAARGVVCASAGNHAQGVAFSCARLGIKAYIFMPETTPEQKQDAVRYFGGERVEIILSGDTFDAAAAAAVEFASGTGRTFVPPFDDPEIIAGQGTVAREILQKMDSEGISLDYVFVPIGGGGLASGVGTYIKACSPLTKVIGVEPEGAASMKAALREGGPVTLPEMNTFVDGAAVRRAGNLTYQVCREVLDDIVTVPEGAVCTTLLRIYNSNGIVLEPAGALSITALRFCTDMIKGKNVCCILSGSNNDVNRMAEIQRLSKEYESAL